MGLSVIARFVVPAAAAVMLTFGRNGMLPFEGSYTPFDQAINVFVVLVAPFFVLRNYFPHPRSQNFRFLLPFLVLVAWIIVCVSIGSPRNYWPPLTTVITIFLSALYATQISRGDLRRLRHCMLILSGVFSLYALIGARFSLGLIFSGDVHKQLGLEFSRANVIILPRVLYMLIVTGLISIIIEKDIWLRLSVGLAMVLPALIALATGGRGPLVAFIVAAVTFALSLKRRRILSIGLLIAVAGAGYWAVNGLFPTLLDQRMKAMDAGRLEIWMEAWSQSSLSLFGNGLSEYYPHNIFLEFVINYGLIGLFLFLLFIGTSLTMGIRFYRKTHDQESLWVLSLFALQLVAQQFSLDIFYGSLWAALLLPLGFSWEKCNVSCHPKSLLSKTGQGWPRHGRSSRGILR